MAQETPKPTEGAQKTEAQGRDEKFHYYSGGEVKELQHTKISPAYWALVSIVLAGAVIYFIVGGAMGPHSFFGGFQPEGGSKANLNKLQGTLASANAGNSVNTVDLNQLPIPAGQTIGQTISKGEQVYLTYCIGCHGPNQDGNGVSAATLNPKPRNLRDGPFMQAMSYQRINTSLHKGVPGTAMPRWENLLTQDEISEVIAYAFSLTSPTPSADTTPSLQGNAGGTQSYTNGTQNSPKPITPSVGGNPAAPTSTAPPSLSGPTPTGPTPEQGAGMASPNTAPGLGSENNAQRPKSLPTSGGQSAKPLLAPGATTTPATSGPVKPGNQSLATSPAAPAPKPGAPTPGSPTSPTSTTSAGNTAPGR